MFIAEINSQFRAEYVKCIELYLFLFLNVYRFENWFDSLVLKRTEILSYVNIKECNIKKLCNMYGKEC